MPEVEVYITDRPGTGSRDTSRRVFQYSELTVRHGISAARECRFKTPIFDVNSVGQSNVQHIKLPLRRFVKVYYLGRLIFWGPIIKPIFNLKDQNVEVNCLGGSAIWMMNHHFHTGDFQVEDGVGYTGQGLADLTYAAYLTASEAASGFKELPMLDGTLGDSTPLLDADDNEVLYIPEVGENVWDSMMEISDSAAGPEFDLLPIDETQDPDGVYAGASDPKPICQLDTYAPGGMGQDRTDHIFHFGFGRTNLDNFIYEPDGALCRNRFVAQHEDNKDLIRVAKHGDSMQANGIMEGWETPVGDYTADGLATFAEGQVKALGAVPEIFSIEPTWDQGLMGSAASTPWRYPTGFYPGDTLRGVAKRGSLSVDLEGRVTEVTLTQVNAAENVRSQVEMVPSVLDVDVVVEDEA